MTDTEIYHILEHDAFNKSWFARKLFKDEWEVSNYHQKLKYGTFNDGEMNRLREILKNFANSEI